MATEFTRGKSHAELLAQRSSLREEIRAMPSDERSNVLAHLYGSGASKDLSKARLENLRHYDINDRTKEALPSSSTTARAAVKSSLHKRQSRPNSALQRQIHRRETKRLQNAILASDVQDILAPNNSGYVETEHDMERTLQLTQNQLKYDGKSVATNVTNNIYHLELMNHGPYILRYDRSGRHALIAGRGGGGGGAGGHLAIVDQHTLASTTEFFIQDVVRDACFLQDSSLLAVSQRQNVYIYDDKGAEVHRLGGHQMVTSMEFLPYHWLLATIGTNGVLQYQDTSTGDLVSQHRTKLGPCCGAAMRQNPFNSILHVGHSNGTVTLWSPSSSEYLVKMLCHRGSPITSLAMDRSGRYMATGGSDSKVKIFDLRMYKEIHAYTTYGGPPTALDISQTGVLGIGHGCHTTFWKAEALPVKAKEPYMKHQFSGKGPMESLRFRPFEDAAGIGHAGGVSSIVIPGSGEPNLDSMEHFTNPYADKKQRREAEVRSLLEKLSPEMISLDPDTVGGIEGGSLIQRAQRSRDAAEDAKNRRDVEREEAGNAREKKRMRGRSKIAKKLRRKQKNVVDENVIKLRELRDREKAEKEESRKGSGESGEGKAEDEAAPAALRRFF